MTTRPSLKQGQRPARLPDEAFSPSDGQLRAIPMTVIPFALDEGAASDEDQHQDQKPHSEPSLCFDARN
jgi:hypothetical protein